MNDRASHGGFGVLPIRQVAALFLLAVCVVNRVASGQDGRQGFGQGPDSLLAGPLKAPGNLQSRIRFQHLTSLDGLSQDSVFSILQDHKGFLWFGTQGGLNRYDGYRFTQYRHDPKDPNSPASDFVTDLLEDRQGIIWFAATVLNRFDPATGSFIRYAPAGISQLSGDRAATRILQDRNGFLWLGSDSGHILYRFEPGTAAFTQFDISGNGSQEPHNPVHAIHEDRAGKLWIGTARGLLRLDPATGSVQHYTHAAGDNSVFGVASDADGKIWVAYASGLRQFDPTTQQFTGWAWREPGMLRPSANQAMYTDSGGMLWVGTPGGLRILDPQSGQWMSLHHDPTDRHSLSANDVLAVNGDREGNLWVGVKGAGVNRFSPEHLRFGAWRRDPSYPDGLSDSNVRAIHKDRLGVVWIGTYSGGLNSFEPGSGEFQRYRHNPKEPQSLNSDQVLSIYEDRSGTLWIGTVAGVNRLNRRTGTFDRFERSGPGSRAYTFLEDRLGRFWIGGGATYRTLLDRRTGKLTLMDTPTEGGLSIYEDRAGRLWFNSPVGLSELNPAGATRQIRLSDAFGSGGPPRLQVNFVHEDSEGILWLATETGLVHFDPKTGKYAGYTTQDGLPDNIVQCILPDDAGNLWISTNRGISRFNPLNRSFANYFETDGLQGNTFNRKACFRDEAGWMYFGGLSGLNVFHPRPVGGPSRVVAPIVITELQIHGKTIAPRVGTLLPKPIWMMSELRLPYKENGFSFEFAALNYANPEKVHYRFRLDGLESQWTEVGSRQRYARYTDVRPGPYLFRVQASLDVGRTWQEKETSLPIDIHAPWWMTKWSKAAALFILVSMIVGLYKLRVRTLHRMQDRLDARVQRRTAQLRATQEDLKIAKEKAEEATALKSMFLANMSHEIRTPMNAVIGMAHLALKTPLNQQQRDYVNKIHHAGISLLGIINDILDFSKIEAGRLDVAAVTFRLDDVIASATSITVQKAHDKGLEFLTRITGSFPHTLVGDPLRLGQIITNLIDNAIKFTECGEIFLEIELAEHTGGRVKLQFSVKDTGIGMTQEHAAKLFQPFTQADMSATRKHGGTGLGLSICKRLVELMGGEISVETEVGSGSTFRFSVWLGVASAARTGVVPTQLRSLRALVVDDHAAAREILGNSLSNLCGRVDIVSSGAEALAAVKHCDSDEPYDVIFMDWRMPGMDGLEATRHIREDPELKAHPAVLLVTAFGIDEIREEAERIPVNGFLLKPVTMSMLVDVLASLFAADAEGRAADAPSADHYAGALNGVRILLTEDNEINQQIAIELLVGAGATVDVANNGMEAIGKLTNEPLALNFDVVLMDLQMPLLDGYETTKQLRSDPRFADLPIIAMTAHATVEERQKCLDLGMNDHVPKPVDPAALFDAIRRVAISRPVDRLALPPAPAFTPTLQQDALSHIVGLDSAGGLQRVAGNRKLYVKLLRQFVTTEADAAERIAAALTVPDRNLAERLAHTVKGVAGNIGASTVQNAAANLERAIVRSATAADIESWVATLGDCIAKLVSNLNISLDAWSDEPAASADPGQAQPKLDQLLRYLAESDAAALECFEFAAPALRVLFGAEKYEQFAHSVENYDFSEAYEQLKAAANENGLTIRV